MKKFLALVVAAAMLLGVCSVSMAEKADLESILSGLLYKHPELAYALGYIEDSAYEAAAENDALANALGLVCENCCKCEDCEECENCEYCEKCEDCECCECCKNCENCEYGCCGLCAAGKDILDADSLDAAEPFGLDLFESSFLSGLFPKDFTASLAKLFGEGVPEHETADETENRCIDCNLTAFASSLYSLLEPFEGQSFSLSNLFDYLSELLISAELGSVNTFDTIEAIDALEDVEDFEELEEASDIGELFKEYLKNHKDGENGYTEASAFSSEYSSFSNGDKTTYNVDSNLSYKAPNGRWININRTENEKPGSEKTSIEKGRI